MAPEINETANKVHAACTDLVNENFKQHLPPGKTFAISHIALRLTDIGSEDEDPPIGPILDCINPVIINGHMVCPES